MFTDNKGNPTLSHFIATWAAVVALSIITVILGMGLFYGLNKYWVWSARMQGEQELARAEGNRKIAIQEAKAKNESSKELAEAEIIRARGVAEANKIIGESLKHNESYLRYLWIQSLDHSNNKIIYVPTEAGLPILEASRLKSE